MPAIHCRTSSSACSSTRLLPSGGICSAAQREPIRCASPLRSGWPGSIRSTASGDWPGAGLRIGAPTVVATPGARSPSVRWRSPSPRVRSGPSSLWQCPQFACRYPSAARSTGVAAAIRGGARQERLRQPDEESGAHENLEVEIRGRPRLGVQRARVAVGRELKQAEAEHRRAAGFVADAAVAGRRDRVGPAPAEGVGAAAAPFRRERGRAPVLAPFVGGVEPPSVRQALDVARLHPASAEGELLPEPCAARKDPGLGIGSVDGGAGRQRDPASLAGPVRPERILRREGEVRRIDLQALEARIEAGIGEGRRRLRRRRRKASEQRPCNNQRKPRQRPDKPSLKTCESAC